VRFLFLWKHKKSGRIFLDMNDCIKQVIFEKLNLLNLEKKKYLLHYYMEYDIYLLFYVIIELEKKLKFTDL